MNKFNVDQQVQGGLYKAGIRSVAAWSVMASSEQQLEEITKKEFHIDPSEPGLANVVKMANI